MSRIVDQDLDLRPLRKHKVYKRTDSKAHDPFKKVTVNVYSENITNIFKVNIFKVKQLYNSHNDAVYVPKKMRKLEVPEGKLFCEIEASPK